MLIHQRSKERRIGRSPIAIGVTIAIVGFLCGIFAQYCQVIEKTQSLVKTQATELPVRTVAWMKAPTLPVINIDMKFKHFEKIKLKREEALKQGVLLANSDDFVPAELRVEGRTIPVKMRLKGDWTDHLIGKKWSYRVHVKGADQLWGMRSLSLHHPMTRNWDAEWLYHQHIRREGVLGLRYQFVRVALNGDPLGIYAVEEHFSKELLESQHRKEGVIVKADETGFWEQQAKFGTFKSLRQEKLANSALATFKDSRVDASPALRSGRDAAYQLLHDFAAGKIKPSKAFKVKQLARYLAITELWGSEHGLHFHNLRWYYDPLAAKLEPIAFDGNALKHSGSGILGPKNEWVRIALSDDEIAAAFAAELERMSSPKYVADFKHSVRDSWTDVYNSIKTEWPNFSLNSWSGFERRNEYIRSMFREIDVPLTGRYFVMDGQIQIELSNALKLPLEISGFTVNGEAVDSSTSRIYPREWPNKKHDHFTKLDLPKDELQSVTAHCNIMGRSQVMKFEIQKLDYRFQTESNALPSFPNADEFLKKHAFIERVDETSFRTLPGEWKVDGDLAVPQKHFLQITPGTTLQFADDAVLISTEKLDAIGTEDDPISLEPIGQSWSGVAVLNATTSDWQHVRVRDTTSIERNGWILTGGVTFYHSPVKMRECQFEGSRGEDALNIVSAQFLLDQCDFSNTQSDAFDGDYVVGSVQDCRFSHCFGDAIDFSGSEVVVQKTVIRHVADKGISAGENSNIRINDVYVTHAQMAIVSKDLSHVEVENALVADAKFALAAFQKKPEFGTATIDAKRVTILRVKQKTLSQKGSEIVDDLRVAPATNFNTQELYAELETSNDLAAK
jgi:hypothetical protein